MEKSELLPAPTDHYNIIWFLCSFLGVGQLFPWNAFISASDYFTFLFRPFPFTFVLPIAFNWGNFITFVLLTKYGHYFSEKKRLYSSFFVSFAVLFLVPVINLWNWNNNARIALTLMLSFVQGIFIAIMMGTGFSFTAILPMEYTGAVMAGQGIAGVVAGVLKICVNFWWFPNLGKDKNQMMTSGVLYFGIASLLMVVVAASTWFLTHTSFFRYYQNESISVAVPGSRVFNISESLTLKPPSLISVFRQIWVNGLHVSLVFIVTLTLFPGFTTTIRNYDSANMSDANFILILINLFQVFDVIGRLLPKWVRYPNNSRYLRIPIWFRLFLFTPLFMLSVYTDLLPNNAIPCIVMVFFAFSNGYLSTLCMMYSTDDVKQNEVKIGGMLMAFFLQFGVFFGVHLAMLLLYLISLA